MENTLYIPLHVNNESEYLTGFGKRELKFVLTAVVIGIFLGFLWFGVNAQILSIVFPPAAFGGVVFALVIKDRTNESVIDKLKFMRNFGKTQKSYEYIYFNIYEGEIHGSSAK